MQKFSYTDKDVAAWKAQHGDIFSVKVEGKEVILTYPPIPAWAKAFEKAAQGRTAEMSEILVKGGYVAGDKELLDNDALIGSVIDAVEPHFVPAEAEVEEVGNVANITIEGYKAVVNLPGRAQIKKAQALNGKGQLLKTGQNLLEMITVNIDKGISSCSRNMVSLIIAVEGLREAKMNEIKKL